MARPTNKLTAMRVDKIKDPGMYGDGGGLWLQVGPSGSKAWIFRYTRHGKQRYMGLGPTMDISLLEAREAATRARKTLREGIDPIDKKQDQARQNALEEAKSMTFRDCAQAYIDAHKAGWKNAKNAAQWTSTLKTYAYPEIGNLAVAGIDTGLVMRVIEPIWTVKPETAARVRGRIERVLDWATVRGYRQGENPARLKGHLDHLLPQRKKVQSVKHYAALPYDEIGAFVKDLRSRDGVAAKGLEFAILTAARTGEVIGATWDEIDLTNRIWTVSADRTKTQKEYRVPLSSAVLLVLEQMAAIRQNDFVFPGNRPKRPLSNMAFLMMLRRMDRDDLTAHGFRSTFRDWAAERTAYPREVAEMALGHAIGDKVEAAYRRGDLFEKRTRLMQDWADFCAVEEPTTGQVLTFGAR